MPNELDMTTLTDLCARHDIRRNQRISTLMDVIDDYQDDDDQDDDDQDEEDEEEDVLPGLPSL